MSYALPAAARLRDLLSYDPATGAFRWRMRASNRAPGGVAGCIGVAGYRVIGIDGARYYAHRIAWCYMHGEWPSGDIDHINGDRADNRAQNLRAVTRAENAQNRRSAQLSNPTGLLGVTGNGGGYMARIKINSRQKYLGQFNSAEAAHDAYVQAKRVMHPMGTL